MGRRAACTSSRSFCRAARMVGGRRRGRSGAGFAHAARRARGAVPLRVLTGQQSAILHSFIGWHQPNTLPKLLDRLKPLPMLAIKTGGIVAPRDRAGRGDSFLLELNRVLAAFGARLRPAHAGDERPLERVRGLQSRRILSRPAVFDSRLPEGVRPDRDHRPRRSGSADQCEAAQARPTGDPSRSAADPGEDGLEPAGLRTRTSRRTPLPRTTRATRTSMWWPTTSTTRASRRPGTRTRRCTPRIETSPSGWPSGACGRSTIQRSSSVWPTS